MKLFQLGLAPVLLLACASAGATDTLAPFVTPAGDLRLVDPALALGEGNPQTVDTGLTQDEATGAQGAISGTLTGLVASDVHSPYLVYVKGGQVFRIDLRVGMAHAPARVSSITDACVIENVANDFANPLRSRLIVRRQGADLYCGTNDDLSTVVRLSSGTDASGPSPRDLWSIDPINTSTGAIAGFVTAENFKLRHRDASFATPVNLLRLASSQVSRYEVPMRHIYFCVTRANQTQQMLYRYDMGANGTELVGPLHVFANTGASINDAAYDSQFMYFADGNRVYRTPFAATARSQTQFVTRGPSEQQVGAIAIAPGSTAVVFSSNGTNFAGGVYAAPKTAAGALATPLRTNNLMQGKVASLAGVSGNLVYINYSDFFTSSNTAVRMSNDGTGAVNAAGAFWGGFTQPSSLNLASSEPDDQLTFVIKFTLTPGSAEVRLVQASTGANSRIMGSFANPVAFQPGFAFGSGRYGGVAAIIDRGGDESDVDLFLFDTTVADSLQGVSQTPGGDDLAIGGL